MSGCSAWALALGIFRAALLEQQGTPATLISAAGPEIVEPPTLRSANGVLDMTLTATPARVEVAGRSVLTNVYNGLYIPRCCG
ncbi:MAG: hypothetical protein WDN31_03815 [Hyphomicrobium sp.]